MEIPSEDDVDSDATDDIMGSSEKEILRGLFRDDEEIVVTPNPKLNSSKMLNTLEDELAASGDLNKTTVINSNEKQLPLRKSDVFRSPAETLFNTDETMSTTSKSSVKSRGSRGSRGKGKKKDKSKDCLLYTSPSPRD